MLQEMLAASGGSGGGTPSLANKMLCYQASAGNGTSGDSAYPYGHFVCNVIGVNSISFSVSYKCKLYGWAADDTVTLIDDFTAGAHTGADVTSYVRLSALRSTGNVTTITGITAEC